jgi:hypothetical protein
MPYTIIEGKRYDLSKFYAVPNCRLRENHGISREGIWVTKSGRVIVETYSAWASSRNDGTVVGTQYHFADPEEIANLAAELDDERLTELVPMADDA